MTSGPRFAFLAPSRIGVGVDTDRTGTHPLERLARLTPRRRELLELASLGLTNEQIAERLAISPATVRTHFTTVFSDLGVKNRTEAVALLLTRPASNALDLGPFMRRPAIAVLPIDAGTSEPTASFANALGDELSSLFARWCSFPVIARSSSRSGRTLGATAAEIGQALGARFLVDGSLRVHGSGWRLRIQVDDAASGMILWSDSVDFAHDPFEALQETCSIIVARAYPVLAARVQAELSAPVRPPDLQAWQLAHQALTEQARRDHAGYLAALELCENALMRDPTLLLAHLARGLCAYDATLNQWVAAELGRARLLAAAEQLLTLAPHMAEGYFLLARHHQTSGDHARAITALESAISRNPSFAPAYALLAQALMLCDRTDEGLVRMEQALRLGPRSFVAGLATLQFAAGRFNEAVESAERAIAIAPRYAFARALAAAAAYCGGELARANDHLRRLREACPGFEPKSFLETFGPEVLAVARLSTALESLMR